MGTSRSPLKTRHLDANPYVSVSYWSPKHETAQADCRASWAEDACTYDAIATDAARDQFRLKAVLMGIVHTPRFSRRLAP